MWAGRDVRPVGALFSAGCLSVPMWGVRGAPACAACAYRVVREAGEAPRLARDLSRFLERCGQFWSAAWGSLRAGWRTGTLGFVLLVCSPIGVPPVGVFIGAAVGLIVSILRFRRPHFVGAALRGPAYLPVRFAGAMGSRIFMLDIYGMVPYTRSNGWAMGLTQANGPQGGKVVG